MTLSLPPMLANPLTVPTTDALGPHAGASILDGISGLLLTSPLAGVTAPSFEELLAVKTAAKSAQSGLRSTFSFSELGLSGLAAAISLLPPAKDEPATATDAVENTALSSKATLAPTPRNDAPVTPLAAIPIQTVVRQPDPTAPVPVTASHEGALQPAIGHAPSPAIGPSVPASAPDEAPQAPAAPTPAQFAVVASNPTIVAAPKVSGFTPTGHQASEVDSAPDQAWAPQTGPLSQPPMTPRTATATPSVQTVILKLAPSPSMVVTTDASADAQRASETMEPSTVRAELIRPTAPSMSVRLTISQDTEMENASHSAEAPAELPEPSNSTKPAPGDGASDVNVVVSQQDGEVQLSIAAPPLSADAEARLRTVANETAAEFGVSITDFAINGSVVTTAPSANGARNGRNSR